MFEQEVDAAGRRETGQAEHAHWHRRVLCGHFGDGRTETAVEDAFLGGDDTAGFLRCSDHRVGVDRLDGRHVEYACLDAFLGQQIGGGERARDERTDGDQGHIVPVSQLIGLAHGENVIFRRHGWNLVAANAHVRRLASGRRPTHRFTRLLRVGRGHDNEVGDRAHPGEVLDRMVRRAELAVGETGAHGAEHGREVAVGDVGLDLLGCATGKEGTGGADEGQEPAIGQTGGDADHVLLGDADVDQTIRELLGEGAEIARSNGVVAHRNDALVGSRQFDQRFDKGLPAIEGRYGGDLCGFVSAHFAAPSSAFARSNCSADGTL